MRGFVFSDLHMFSFVSEWERRMPSIEQGCRKANIVVMNGDLFEFKRSRFPTRDETVSAAVAWLKTLVEMFPQVKFEYLLGNHDCAEDLVRALRGLADGYHNLRITDDFLVLGKNLFLHGDVCDSGPSREALAALRTRYSSTQRSLTSIAFAELVTRTRLNAVEYLRRKPETLAAAISAYLSNVAPELHGRIERIFFGHTHVPFTGFKHAGITFENTGCAVHGLGWAPKWFEYEER